MSGLTKTQKPLVSIHQDISTYQRFLCDLRAKVEAGEVDSLDGIDSIRSKGILVLQLPLVGTASTFEWTMLRYVPRKEGVNRRQKQGQLGEDQGRTHYASAVAGKSK